MLDDRSVVGVNGTERIRGGGRWNGPSGTRKPFEKEYTEYRVFRSTPGT